MSNKLPQLTEQEWCARFKQRFIERADLSPEIAQSFVDDRPFSELSEFFEDDPEGCADEEMSYWDAD